MAIEDAQRSGGEAMIIATHLPRLCMSLRSFQIPACKCIISAETTAHAYFTVCTILKSNTIMTSSFPSQDRHSELYINTGFSHGFGSLRVALDSVRVCLCSREWLFGEKCLSDQDYGVADT